MKKVLSLGLVLGIAAVSAYAYPTLAGPTGYGVLPTADVVGSGVWNIAADYYDSSDSTVPIRVVYGIGPNFEVGVSYRSGDQFVGTVDGDGLIIDENGFEQGFAPFVSDISISDMWGINGKYRIPTAFGGFCWSLGAQYLQGDIDTNGLVADPFENVWSFSGSAGDYQATQVYFVGTRNFTPNACPGETVFRGTLGFNWTRVELDYDSVDFFADVDPTLDLNDLDVSSDEWRFFLGADVTFGNKLMLIGEYQTDATFFTSSFPGFEREIEADPLYAITARYPFNENLAGQVGYTNEIGGVLGGSEGNFFLGLNYGFASGCLY